jgi:hypothetical protein
VNTTGKTTQRILLASAGLVAVLGIGSVAYGATTGTPVETPAVVAGTVSAEPAVAAVATTPGTEAESIAFMAEEEKLARDVYLTLGDMWDARIFTNIAGAEQMHMDAVLDLAVAGNLEDPVGDNPIGVFNDVELQALYDDLVAQGAGSYEAALEVGALVEEVDIEDLVAYLEGDVSPEVAAVYEHLLSGSENHLRAFAGQLSAAGIEHAPTVLDRATYDRILSEPAGHGRERPGNPQGGGPGHGQGHGQGRGQGRGANA